MFGIWAFESTKTPGGRCDAGVHVSDEGGAAAQVDGAGGCGGAQFVERDTSFSDE